MTTPPLSSVLFAFHRLGEALTRATGLDEVLAVALDALEAALDVRQASILLADADGVMRFHAWRGLSAAYRTRAEGHSPWPADARDPEPIVVEDVSQAAGLETLRDAILAEGIRSLAFVPLVQAGRLVGKFMLYRSEVHRFDEGELTVARTLASQIVFAIDRTRSEAALQRSESRWRLLAQSGAALAGPLEPQKILDGFARLTVPILADFTIIYVIDGEGALAPAAWAHADPRRAGDLAELLATYRPGDVPRNAVLGALRDGNAVLVEDVQQEAAAVRGEKRQPLVEVARRLGSQSSLVLPLQARGQNLGVMTLTYAASGRRYEKDDLPFAEELARRTALAVDNARLYERLRDADRRKDEFLAMLSHELRNPLATITTAVELLKHGQEEPRVRESTRGMIERQARHMARLVDDLLDVARITQGKIRLRRRAVDLRRTLAETVEVHRIDLGPGQDLRIELPDEPTWVEADPARLEEVISNLVSNAVKYGNDGPITVSLEAAEDGKAAVIRIRDTGVGIAPSMIDSVFDLFVQGEVTLARSDAGLGIGLTLVRSLVEMHGGRVWAESDGPGRGSTFSVSLPRIAAPAEDLEEAEHRVETGFRILLVEDSTDTAEALAELLELWGHRVLAVRDGAAALEAISPFRPDLVLLDIGLPGMDGFEVARRIRADPRFGSTPLVALTGYGQEADVRRTAAGGFDHHLVKPVDLHRLQRLLAAGARPAS